MAPELAKGQPASPASDLYALAVLAYELLVGRPPFWGENSLAILHQQVAEPPPPLSHWVEGLPRGIEERMAEALSKDPARRPFPCRVFAEGLASLLSAEERAALPALPTRPLFLSGSAARSAAMGGAAEAVGTSGAIGSSAARTDLGSAPTILEANGNGPSSSSADQMSRSALTPGIGRWTRARLAWTALVAAAAFLAGGVWWLQ